MLMPEITALDHQTFSNNDHHHHLQPYDHQILRPSSVADHQTGAGDHISGGGGGGGASVLLHEYNGFFNAGSTNTVLQTHHGDKITVMSSPPPLALGLVTLMGTLLQRRRENLATSNSSLLVVNQYDFVAPTIDASRSSSVMPTFQHQLSPELVGAVANDYHHQNHHQFQRSMASTSTDSVIASTVANNNNRSLPVLSPRDPPYTTSSSPKTKTTTSSSLPLVVRPEAFVVGQPRSSAQATSSTGTALSRVSAGTSELASGGGKIISNVNNIRNRSVRQASSATHLGQRSSSGSYALQQRSVSSPKALTRSKRNSTEGRGGGSRLSSSDAAINRSSGSKLGGAFRNHLDECYGGAAGSSSTSTADHPANSRAGNLPPLAINGGINMGSLIYNIPYVDFENERYELTWEV